ncbi:MAG: hypothetical protein HQL99_05115 [Magnetococcales bacterium]|nr:hypothetical protein [Magnetococcales bacterium]
MNTRHHYRVIAIVDPLPAGENTARQVMTLLNGSRVRDLLWVTLMGDIGLGSESCHVPFLTPAQWQQQTQEALEQRFKPLAQSLDMPRWEFKLLAGPANRALSELSASWGADLILTPQTEVKRITGRDAPAWLCPPHPLTGAVHPLPAPPSRLATLLKPCRDSLFRLWPNVHTPKPKNRPMKTG